MKWILTIAVVLVAASLADAGVTVTPRFSPRPSFGPRYVPKFTPRPSTRSYVTPKPSTSPSYRSYSHSPTSSWLPWYWMATSGARSGNSASGSASIGKEELHVNWPVVIGGTVGVGAIVGLGYAAYRQLKQPPSPARAARRE